MRGDKISTTSSAKAATPAGVVRLTRWFSSVEVDPPCLDILGALQTRVRVLATTPGGFSVVRAAPLDLYPLKIDGALRPEFLVGLEPAVRCLLERAGRKVRLVRVVERENRTVGVADPPPDHLPPAAASVISKPYVLDQPLLDCVRTCERARIRYNPAMVNPASLVAQIAHAWPDRTVLVLAARRDDVHELRRRLRRLRIDADAVTGQNNPAAVGRVAVATYVAMAHPPIAHEWRDVVVALDAAEAVGKKARFGLSHAWRARWFGLLADGVHVSPFEEDRLRELFGFEEVYVPRHFHYETPVDVVRCRIEGGTRLRPGLDDVALKRQGIWRNAMRNRRIARLAQLLRQGDVDRLRQQFPDIARCLGGSAAASVFVLVENVEHGLRLARLLPDWPLVAGPAVALGGLSAADEDRLAAGRPERRRPPPFAVVTAAGLLTLFRPAPGVLVRADGGGGLPALGPIDLLASNAYPGRRLVLVDFDDRHHPELRRRSRRRQEAYGRRGWFAAGVEPVQARVDRFLATRPKEATR